VEARQSGQYRAITRSKHSLAVTVAIRRRCSIVGSGTSSVFDQHVLTYSLSICSRISLRTLTLPRLFAQQNAQDGPLSSAATTAVRMSVNSLAHLPSGSTGGGGHAAQTAYVLSHDSFNICFDESWRTLPENELSIIWNVRGLIVQSSR
jgi:hypothetical protein